MMMTFLTEWARNIRTVSILMFSTLQRLNFESGPYRVLPYFERWHVNLFILLYRNSTIDWYYCKSTIDW
jgi:hypothetical protein